MWHCARLFKDHDYEEEERVQTRLKINCPIYYIEEDLKNVKSILRTQPQKLDEIRAMLNPQNRDGHAAIILKEIITKHRNFPLVVLTSKQKLYYFWKQDQLRSHTFLLEKFQDL